MNLKVRHVLFCADAVVPSVTGADGNVEDVKVSRFAVGGRAK